VNEEWLITNVLTLNKWKILTVIVILKFIKYCY